MDLTSLRRDGHVKFRAASEENRTEQIAKSIGEISCLPGIEPIQHLRPRPSSGLSDASYSGAYGLGAFPLHSDMAHWACPPRYILLRCVVPDYEVSTTLVRSMDLFVDGFKEDCRRALFKPRRPLMGSISLLPLLTAALFRWDQRFIVPASPRAEKIRVALLERIHSARVKNILMEDALDCLLIDNWSSVHGRSQIPGKHSPRSLDRVYLSSINGDCNED